MVAAIAGGCFYFYKNKPEEETPTKIVEVDSIEKYGYVLEDRDTELYKTLFKELQGILNADEVDKEKYASTIAKMYIVDLYTIENKINKYDIGSLDFIHPLAKENFELKVQDTLYKYVEDNTYGKRTQSLPKVSDIKVADLKKETIDVGEKKEEAFVFNLNWDYENGEGYDKSATVYVVDYENKMVVVKETIELES